MPTDKTRETRFTEFVERQSRFVFKVAWAILRNTQDAEDIVQETFFKSLRAFDSFEPSTNFKAWIFCILRNTFLTSRTGISVSRTVFLEDQACVFNIAAADPSPEEIVIRLDNQEVLRAALEQLQPSLREVLLLCDVDEMKYKDIALILGVPIGTVMSRISRARQALRQILRPQLGEFQ